MDYKLALVSFLLSVSFIFLLFQTKGKVKGSLYRF